MRMSVEPALLINSLAVFNIDMSVWFIGSDYEDDFKAAFNNVMQQINNYQRNGSGGVFNQFVELDVSIVTYAPFMGKDIDDDDDNYNEENVEREDRELWKTMNLWS